MSEDFTTIERVPRRLIIAGDNDTPELLRDASHGVHLLVHEATYTQKVSDRVGPMPQHSSAARVAAFAQDAGLPNLILMHFSSRYQLSPRGKPSIGEIEQEARAYFHGDLHLARDLATWELRKDLSLARLDSSPAAD